MTQHTQTIRRQVAYHFVKLVLQGLELAIRKHLYSQNNQIF